MTSAVRNILTGTATKYVLLAVNVGLGILLMPFTVRHLGASEYGLWMLVASLTYYFQLLDLGYGNGLVRHVADADARGDVDRVNTLLSTFVVVYAALGVLACVGTLALMLWTVPRFPHLSPADVRRGQLLLAMMGIRTAIGFPMTVFGAATTARQRFALNNTVAIGVALTNGTMTYVVLATGHGLLTLVACTTALGIASYGAYAWTARQAFPELRIRLSSFNRGLVRDVTTFSAYLFVIDVAVQIGFNLDNVVVGAALGTTAVAVYAVTLRIADYQRQLCNQFTGFLFPIAVRLRAAGSVDALQAMLVDGTRIALILVTGVTIGVIGFGRPLIVRWMGAGFEGGMLPLYVLAVAGVVLVGQGPLGSILLGTGRHRLVAFVSLGEAIANLALSVVLVRRFGMLGVAIGTAVPIALANLCILMPASCREVRVPIASFLRLVLVPPVTGAVPAITMCVALRAWAPPISIPAILWESALTGLTYLTAVCAMGLTTSVRARYLSQLRSLRLSPLMAGATRAETAS